LRGIVWVQKFLKAFPHYGYANIVNAISECLGPDQRMRNEPVNFRFTFWRIVSFAKGTG